QRAGWDKLAPAQQYLLGSVGIDPDADVPVRPAVRSQADRWETNLAAARQYHAREGHLQVPRKHVENVVTGDREGGQASVRLGAWLDNTRRRATKLSPERRDALDELGMRW
ncbi:helicase associated domain-containing protein, partial [Streptomyces sp. NPDC085900]|uniref:helicase associated domain-containing protein n=1 Tax=Streptomyces sp. NPDC085900 TaxID=3365737 RepID=UPI0037D53116